MLLSMTGFGEAHVHRGPLAVAVELRTVNSRYFKLTLRAGEGYTSLESQVESAVRPKIKRGTVQVSLRVDRAATAEDYRINEAVLLGYQTQIGRLANCDARTVSITSLLLLPGVVDERQSKGEHVQDDWPVIEETLLAAIENLSKMRREEGQAMADDMRANCAEITAHLAEVEKRAPLVGDSYRTRLVDRLNRMLSEFGVSVGPADVVREVGLFAERTDISEEIVRLRSHLAQFETYMQQEESAGRKLEFLIQEMNRETNTIGSKSNDAELARHVVEMKAALERLREMVQNCE